MDITNINLGACPLQYLSVGYVGETGARPVSFDFSDWATEYGAGVLQLLLQRPGDANPYPVLLDIDGTTATWTPDATATEKTGQGQAQLVYTVGGVVVKNAIFRVLIAPSLGAAGDPPEPYEDWLEQLTELAAETQQNALDAAESAEAAGTSAGAAAGSAGAAAQSALDAEAAKTAAETAEQTAQQAAALAMAKAADAAEAGRIAGENADYAQQQRIMAADSAEAAYESAENAAQSAAAVETDLTAIREDIADLQADKADKTALVFERGSGESSAQQIGLTDNASGRGSFAHGGQTEASGVAAHAEGYQTHATGQGAHAEGYGTTASGGFAHAEGNRTTASGIYSHSEGADSTARGTNSHAEGVGTIAKNSSQHVGGRYNVADPSTAAATEKGTYAEIIGNGTGAAARSNARTLDWEGNERLAGDLTIHAGGADETTVGEALDEIEAALDDLKPELDTKAPAIYKTAGPAAVVTVDDGAEDMPLKQIAVDIPVTQTGSGDPSPDNVRPISGWNSVEVEAAGENLWGGSAFLKLADNWANAVVDTDAMTLTGRVQDLTTRANVFEFPFKQNTKYTIFVNASVANTGLYAVYADGTEASLATTRFVSNPSKTLAYLRFFIATSSAITFYANGIGVFEGDLTDDDFQPYKGQLINIDWTDTAGDVYAGTLTIHADGSAELAALPHYASYAGETLVGPWVSSMDVYAEGATPTTGAEVIDLGGVATVYQLTAEQIRTLAGVNNLWSDAGEVTAEYPADTKAYIDVQVAALSGQIDTLGGEVDTLQDDVDALEAAQPKTVTVTGTTPVITAVDNTRYICGEVSTLDITLPASGCIDVIFESGSTPTVLTVTPPTGVTVKWANGFDPDSLEASTVYEINIANGLGVAAAWT